MEIDEAYEVLGVNRSAEDIVIEAAYKSLAKEYHPDQGGDPDKFKRIKAAYGALQEDTNRERSNKKSAASSDPAAHLGDALFEAFHTPTTTETIVGSLSDDLVIQGDYFTIALTGLTKMDISEYVFDHKEDDIPTENRLLATFHVVNTSNDIHSFKVYDVRVIGKDGYQHEVIPATIDQSRHGSLPGNLSTGHQDMEPKTQADVVGLVEAVPDDFKVDRIVYPQKIYAKGNTDGWVQEKHRYEFDIQPEHWKDFQNFAAGQLDPPEGTPETIQALKELDDEPHYDEVASLDDLEIDAISRLRDIVDLQPTTNNELKERWGMENGSEVHSYLESELADFYYRNDDEKICAIERATASLSHDDETS